MTMWLAGLIAVLAWWAPRGRALVIAAVLAGGARASIEDLGGRVDVSAIAHGPGAVDDRVIDQLTGVITGPIEQRHGRARFSVCVDPPSDLCVRVTAEPGTGVAPGDRIAVSGRLRTPRGYRVPGAFDVGRVVRARGDHLVMSARSVDIIEPGAEWSIWNLSMRIQDSAASAIATRGGRATGNALVRAMVTGDRAGLSEAQEQRFRAAGLAHLLAVSGLHLAAVALLAFAVARRVWASSPALAMRLDPARFAALVAAPLAIGYTLMTGAKISTLRALLVVLVVLIGVAVGRRARVIDALGVAALALLMHRPDVLLDPSFQLSFSATATLALALKPAVRRPGRVARALGLMREAARASLWATLATAPFTALAFGSIAIAGVASNVIAVPLTELIVVPLGLLGCAVSALWPAGGGALIDIAVACAALLDDLAAIVSDQIPQISVYPPNHWELGGVAIIWTAAIYRARRLCSRWRAALAIAGGIAVIGVSLIATTRWLPAARDHLEITFLDVGQGDAAIVELPGGAVWMIDGGGLPFVTGDWSTQERRRLAAAPGRHSVARFLASRRIQTIDRLVLSHPHPDHYQGVRALIGTVDITTAWVARAYPHVDDAYRDLLAELRASGTRVVHPRLDRPYRHRGVTVTVLAPRYLDDVATADPVCGANDNSLVIRVAFAGRVVLFTGDIEREAEQLLVDRYRGALAADIVKVPHHGSRTSSTAPLVAATRPAWAVISCGVANRFGFPAPEVERRWRQRGASVVRIDQVGAVTAIISRGGVLRVRGFGAGHP